MHKRHHYVPQAWIKKFYNEQNQFFLLDKRSGRISKQQSSKNIFQFENLNTLVSPSGLIDNTSLEKFFKYFEDGFTENFSAIEIILNSASSNPINPLILEAQNSGIFKYFMRLGLIGYCRNPYVANQSLKTIINSLKDVLQLRESEIQTKDNEMLHLNYLELLDGMLKLLGHVYVRLLVSAPKNYFFLPDLSGFFERANKKIKHNDDGLITFEIKNHISRMILPISPRIVIEFDSIEFPYIEGSYIIQLSEKDTLLYNRMLLDSAQYQVIASDRNYLKTFLNFIEQNPIS